VALVWLMFAMGACKDETPATPPYDKPTKQDEQQHASEPPDRASDTVSAVASDPPAPPAVPVPQPDLRLSADAGAIDVQGAIAFDTGALVHLVLSTKPLACPRDNSLAEVTAGETRIGIEVVDRLLPTGKTQWVVHERSSPEPLSKDTDDIAIEGVTRDDETVQVRFVEGTRVRHKRDSYQIAGVANATRCKGAHPNWSNGALFEQPGTLELEIQSEQYVVASAVIEEVSDTIRVELGTGPLGCGGAEGANDVVVTFVFPGAGRPATGLALRGNRLRGYVNGVAAGLKTRLIPGTDGTTTVTVEGKLAIAGYTIGFDGGEIVALDCR